MASSSLTEIGPVQAGAVRFRVRGWRRPARRSAGSRRGPEEVVLDRLAAEAVQPVLHVGGVARLGHLAVVDDVDARRRPGGSTTSLHRGGDAIGERALVDRDAVALRPHDLDQVVGPGQAAGVGRQDAVRVLSAHAGRPAAGPYDPASVVRSTVSCPYGQGQRCPPVVADAGDGRSMTNRPRREEGRDHDAELPSRLHHNAFVTKDQEATRAFYEDLIGLPLVATWSEADELFGAVRVYCHTFFGLGDGERAGLLPVRQRRGPGPVRSRADAVAVPPHRPQGDARAAAGDPRPPHGGRLEARRDLRPRARVLPVAVHRGPERPAARVHRRRRRTPTRSPPSAGPTPTRR